MITGPYSGVAYMYLIENYILTYFNCLNVDYFLFLLPCGPRLDRKEA